MKVQLLRPRGNHKAGAVVTVPWRGEALRLIESGAALAVEACDLHLNPKPAEVSTADPVQVKAEAPVAEVPAAEPEKPKAPRKRKRG